jgi:hypothetical protein
MLLKGGGEVLGSDNVVLSQSLAITLLVMIVGAAAYMWYKRLLRSRAALVTLALVVGALAYFAVANNGTAY